MCDSKKSGDESKTTKTTPDEGDKTFRMAGGGRALGCNGFVLRNVLSKSLDGGRVTAMMSSGRDPLYHGGFSHIVDFNFIYIVCLMSSWFSCHHLYYYLLCPI